jgi:urea carboxylase-associated protein 1
MTNQAVHSPRIAPRIDADAIYAQDVPAEAPWSCILERGQTLRIIDSEGQQAVDALLYAADDLTERYSAQDTLRTQGSAYVQLGTSLISNRDRVMARITADSCGQHDTSAGCCSCESNAVRFGEATKYQHACRENFILELSKYGLTKRDIVANLNFFMNVPIDPSGNFTVVDGISAPGNYVDITADMDLVFVISNCPQINNPCNGFNPTPVRVLIWDSPA